jgi:DNA-nicking Smr family endonuclease
MSKKEQPFNNPFGSMKLKQAEVPKKPAAPAPPKQATPKKVNISAESQMFLEAVGAVEQVKVSPTRVGPPAPRTVNDVRIPTEEAESLAALADLVSGSDEFDLADSDAFIEGAVQGFDERVMRKLRAGDFSTQAQVDLHGRTRDEAKLELERFMTSARTAGHRCVLVVTGRGLNSKDQVPVIKQGVQQWLTRGRVSKFVLGFCTARPKDGGAGAVYVLLRR